MVLEKILENTLDCKKNNSMLYEVNIACSQEPPITKLKLKYFGHAIQRQESLEGIVMFERIKGNQQADRWIGAITDHPSFSL